MNFFVLGIGIAYIVAAGYSALNGRRLWAMLYFLWGIGDFVVVVLEMKSVKG